MTTWNFSKHGGSPKTCRDCIHSKVMKVPTFGSLATFTIGARQKQLEWFDFYYCDNSQSDHNEHIFTTDHLWCDHGEEE